MIDHMSDDVDDECTGSGKCHGPLKWCQNCGDVSHVCDMRLRDEKCDEHPIPPEWVQIRAERVAAEKKLRDAEAMKREAFCAISELQDHETARRAYDAQIEARNTVEFYGYG